MKTEITMTKDGGFYYRAMATHYAMTYPVLPIVFAVLVLAIINPFWFREQFMQLVERNTIRFARWRDKVKYRVYLGTDPDFWHALKDDK